MKILILGAGLSGLMAARMMQASGHEVEIWEAATEPGGWARTLSWPWPDGRPGCLERGPQRLLIRKGGALDHLFRDLALPVQPFPSDHPRWLASHGRLWARPDRLAGLLAFAPMTRLERLRIFAEPFVPPSPSSGESLASFLEHRLGSGFRRELLPALATSLLAASPEELDAEALPFLTRDGGRCAFFRAGTAKAVIPTGGIGALASALAMGLPDLKTDLPAERLEPLPHGRWRVHGRGHTADADRLVLALPAFEVARQLERIVPIVAETLAALPYCDLAIWHGRHAHTPALPRGFSLHTDPRAEPVLLGSLGLPMPDGLQTRTFAHSRDAQRWEDVETRLQRWIPSLGQTLQVRQETAPACLPQPRPGQLRLLRDAAQNLPPGLDAIGAWRFGSGIPDLAEGLMSMHVHG